MAPNKAGKIILIIHRLKVEARILNSFEQKDPHTNSATSPLINKPINGGRGTDVCNKKMVAIQASPVNKATSIPKNRSIK